MSSNIDINSQNMRYALILAGMKHQEPSFLDLFTLFPKMACIAVESTAAVSQVAGITCQAVGSGAGAIAICCKEIRPAPPPDCTAHWTGSSCEICYQALQICVDESSLPQALCRPDYLCPIGQQPQV